MFPCTLLSPASKLQVQIKDFNRRIEANVFEVITSRELQHVLRSYKHEAFQKVKYKLDLIEQPHLDKIHSATFPAFRFPAPPLRI